MQPIGASDLAMRGRGGFLLGIRKRGFWRSAAGELRIMPLVQFCQIRQAVYRQLLGIALTSRGEVFNISANFFALNP